MLHAKLRAGLRLPQVLVLTRSLGRRVAEDPETWAWCDDTGAEVQVELHRGRVAAWRLLRPEEPAAPAPA
jgi:hypothetical protein